MECKDTQNTPDIYDLQFSNVSPEIVTLHTVTQKSLRVPRPASSYHDTVVFRSFCG